LKGFLHPLFFNMIALVILIMQRSNMNNIIYLLLIDYHVQITYSIIGLWYQYKKSRWIV